MGRCSGSALQVGRLDGSRPAAHRPGCGAHRPGPLRSGARDDMAHGMARTARDDLAHGTARMARGDMRTRRRRALGAGAAVLLHQCPSAAHACRSVGAIAFCSSECSRRAPGAGATRRTGRRCPRAARASRAPPPAQRDSESNPSRLPRLRVGGPGPPSPRLVRRRAGAPAAARRTRTRTRSMPRRRKQRRHGRTGAGPGRRRPKKRAIGLVMFEPLQPEIPNAEPNTRKE
jgi:hypothetical protein